MSTSPPNALILARSEGHQSHFGTVPEEFALPPCDTERGSAKGFNPRRDRLFRDELAEWRAGRNAVYQLAALTVGACLSVADA
jgi:hypothetical protein